MCVRQNTLVRNFSSLFYTINAYDVLRSDIALLRNKFISIVLIYREKAIYVQFSFLINNCCLIDCFSFNETLLPCMLHLAKF